MADLSQIPAGEEARTTGGEFSIPAGSSEPEKDPLPVQVFRMWEPELLVAEVPCSWESLDSDSASQVGFSMSILASSRSCRPSRSLTVSSWTLPATE